MEQKLRRDRNIGQNLRKLRNKYGFSQEKLCAKLQRRACDISRSTYQKYEDGQLNIRVSVLIELKKIYQCAYDDFFEGLDKQTINLPETIKPDKNY
ncbi:MAG: helix-turn-helix transcriptional regulator [Lachnospiraceae bacterium]|nr:helix-turn-helix transcriptional regulator [Lachnospiraceae bacterium]